MQRREFIALLGGVAAAWPVGAQAQQAGKQYRIGMLETTGEAVKPADIGAFRKGLRDLGYVEGRNVIIEYRSADGRPERFPALAAELVGLNVDLIVTRGTPAAVAAKNATKAIPVVMAAIGDPLLVVASLARPGSNITGLNMRNGSQPDQWKDIDATTHAMGVESQLLDVRKRSDIEPALDNASSQGANALIVGIDTLTQANQQLIIDLAMKHRLPAIYVSREFVDAGGLLAYGVNYPDLYRRAATLVNKIINGVKPADLPVEQPTKFELVINLKTAKALELSIPQGILLRADEMIE